jgi:hypothetical protein
LINPKNIIIKEITDGLGNIDTRRVNSTFLRTNREYEMLKTLPDNGPSPIPQKFSPKFHLVHSQSPRPWNSGQPRFVDKEYLDKLRKELKNPRVDLHEGEHSLFGKNPKCKTCKSRFDKVDQQWMVSPLLGSQYAHIIHNETLKTLAAKT